MSQHAEPGDNLEVAARFDALPATAAFAQAFCARHDVGRDTALRLTLVIEELFTNSIRHGYRCECDAPIRLALAIGDAGVALRYEDDASAYDPLSRAPPASLAQPVEARPVGGIGVHLVARLVSGARYAREDGHNRLWLTLPR